MPKPQEGMHSHSRACCNKEGVLGGSAHLAPFPPVSVGVEWEDHYKSEVQLRVADDVILVFLLLRQHQWKFVTSKLLWVFYFIKD